MRFLRTNETQAHYEANKQTRKEQNLTNCELCAKEPIERFTHWAIVPNEFPYDLIATTHHMFIPLRHVNDTELTGEEWKEYDRIKAARLAPVYDITIETFQRNRTIPEHFHLHLLVCRDSYPELGGV